MIRHFGHTQFSDIKAYGKNLVAVYVGIGTEKRLVWEKASSVNGSGYWANSLPWKNEDPWKNNV